MGLENSIVQFFRLGDRSDLSGIQCFNANTIYQICEQLPYSIYYQTCDIEEHGRGRLEKIAEIFTKARTNAERRSIDRANRPYNSSITKSNTTQEAPATTTKDLHRPLENVFKFWEPRGMTEKFCKTRCIEEENLQYFKFFLLVFREKM